MPRKLSKNQIPQSNPVLPELESNFINKEYILRKGENDKSVDVLLEIRESDLRDLEHHGVIKIKRIKNKNKRQIIPAENAAENIRNIFN